MIFLASLLTHLRLKWVFLAGIGFGLGAILQEELTLTGGVVDQHHRRLVEVVKHLDFLPSTFHRRIALPLGRLRPPSPDRNQRHRRQYDARSLRAA